jgi:heptosyltransferase-1
VNDLVGKDFQRILIIKPSSFGDVIHTLPVLNGLRRQFPRAHIAWLVSTACAGLLTGHPQLDEVIPFDRKRFGRIGRSLTVTLDFIRFVRDLYARRFDLVVDLQGLFRSGFLALASGARVRVGFSRTRELAWIFYSHRLAVPDPDIHAVDRYYLLANSLGFADLPVEFPLPIDPQARTQVHQMLAEGGIRPAQPFALLAPGTRWETKRWPAEHFAQTARVLRDRHGVPVVLAGAPDEVEAARQVAERAGPGVLNLAGRTRVPQLVALVAEAGVVLMNDTGPMHLAAALHKPLIAIFGPTSPARTGPYRRPEAVCRLDLPCSPCYLKRLADCPYNHRCLRELSPEVVADRLAAALTEGK